MDVGFPYFMDARGRTGTVDHETHVRDLIEQVLFTSPGERVNRPTFGSGLMRLVFDPNREELATATQLLVQGSLQQWLGELIQVESTTVDIQGSALHVTVAYRLVHNQERRVAEFSREVP
jgi:phage baseplate assembly protein W